ncbi:hypothetical protein HN51_042378 [Arachis hypogaea]|uniref:Phosphatidate phosphatase PAH2 n=1 Tax=Arachis duranensis TaxID=130453 RepID=A0A6P4DXM0_ARADU|nr:phosphatidate phosphatase PAH2-like [Arachis hypogaea]XP_025606993.1 phosphatidate phosphatase PAH2-like [Arachis hypogaea]XP_025660388.1 phosphatidate phosphatase PAH2-like [Arachis hypogaea]XP_025660389.1 phosphatidate phosphatase PAH2-like [Arachis hypogaea]XP_029143552.1 phosphatidate phosphatase PAH2-like [Arachis hypogaea]XP_029149940.1 phosphatidate phosphatase PAH2-like [Arachis hypogaea]XP_052118640.1 phosphatidate phosphatase PAH2 [Arachis duranensis]QHN88456.1 Phosphatidate pho
MQAVERLGSFITRGVSTVSMPFIPYGGAVDIVVVQQKDGSFKSSPWFVRFGKLHRVLKADEKKVSISVNGSEAGFHMHMNHKGEAFFLRDTHCEQQGDEDSGSSESSSSGEDADVVLPWGRKRNFKSKSCKFDPDGSFVADMNALNNDKIVDRTNSRGSRLFRLVLGQRSFNGEVDEDAEDLLERAEIAANLLDLKWSTNLKFDQLPRRERKNTRGGTLENGLHSSKVDDLHAQQRDCSHSVLDMFDVADFEKLPKFQKSRTISVYRPHRKANKVRADTPTSEQLASLNLQEGRNLVTFRYSTAMLGTQKIDARIYLWKWNTRIVISDVDGTITRSDVLGQVMPLVGIDWSQTGVAHLFSAIQDNGYQLLFLSARAISQACHTRRFLFNLKQDGKVLPDGPVVISPDGLFPALYREVIRRAPHEFKIACLEEIRALFPPDCNPFYAGFGNRDTDELSYLKVGIPKGKIFIINPRGEIAVNCFDAQSYPSLHAVVDGIFPPTDSSEQEDFNSWNCLRLPSVS